MLRSADKRMTNEKTDNVSDKQWDNSLRPTERSVALFVFGLSFEWYSAFVRHWVSHLLIDDRNERFESSSVGVSQSSHN